jgi:transposase
MGREMSEKKKGRWSKEQKFKIALAALKGDKTIAQIAEEFHAHPNQVSEWKKQLLENGSNIFSADTDHRDKSSEKDREELIKTIGHQTVRIDWLKKKLGIEDYRSVGE